MNLTEFSKLNSREKVDLLQNDGVFIGKSFLNHLPVVIYQLEDFYVEIVYLKYRLVISSIRCSKSTKIIEPFLEKINIDELVQTHRLS